MADDDKETIRQNVMAKYADIATKTTSCCSSKKKAKTSCCFSESRQEEAFAKNLGYSANDLKDLPEGANMGLSCGNPTAIASLKEGDVVLDLGSGGGFDVFVVARQVGPSGRAIGVDMTAAMIQKARQNAIKFKERTGLDTVEFRLGEIEHLPVADNSVDVIISNCVINLSPEKEQVWREVARVLKPGGRACISDIALLRPLPDNLRQSVAALVGCVAGASLVDDVLKMVKAAGLVVTSTDQESTFIREMEKSDDPLYADIMKDVPTGLNPHDFVTSLKLVATKPSVE